MDERTANVVAKLVYALATAACVFLLVGTQSLEEHIVGGSIAPCQRLSRRRIKHADSKKMSLVRIRSDAGKEGGREGERERHHDDGCAV
jgi:hypothetical protein